MFVEVNWDNIFPPTWVRPGSCARCPDLCVCHSGSSSSSLSQSASYHSAFLSVGKWNTIWFWSNILHMLTSFTSYSNPLTAHQLLHVTSKMEAGECFLLFSLIICSPLGLLILLTSSLILKQTEKMRTRFEMLGGGSLSAFRKYMLHCCSLKMTLPQDVSVVLFLSHCGFYAAQRAQNDASPAQQISILAYLKADLNVLCVNTFMISYRLTLLQSYLWDEWAPLLPSSCSQSEPQSKSEAPSGLSPSFYDVYPTEKAG